MPSGGFWTRGHARNCRNGRLAQSQELAGSGESAVGGWTREADMEKTAAKARTKTVKLPNAGYLPSADFKF